MDFTTNAANIAGGLRINLGHIYDWIPHNNRHTGNDTSHAKALLTRTEKSFRSILLYHRVLV